MKDETIHDPTVPEQPEIAHAPGLVIDEEPGELADSGVDSELGFEGSDDDAEILPADVPEPEPEEIDERRPPAIPALNVRQDYEVRYPHDPKRPVYERIFLPAGRPEDINAAIDKAPNVRLDSTTTGQDWARALQAGIDTTMIGDAFGPSVLRPDSLWAQNVQSELGVLEAKAPEFGDTVGKVLTGERAMLRMRHFLGRGSVFQVPLWHSGFWVALKGPSDSALLELDRRIMMEKINLGRHVHGLVFSNQGVYIVGWLVDFVLSHIYDVGVDGWGPEDLRKKVDARDIPTLVWGMVCLIWTRGFNYEQSCAAQPEKCQHVTKERLDVTKLHWVDNRALTQWQVTHMAARNKKVTAAAVEKYRNEFPAGQFRKAELSSRVSVVLKHATVEDYLDGGSRWISGIVNMVDRAFALSPDDGERNAAIDEQGQATTMRQFSHYVSEVLLPKGNRIVEPDTVLLALNELSGEESDDDEELADKFMNEVGSFINDTTIAVIAVPLHDCPKCGTPHKASMPRHPNLLPLDIFATFFGLLVQRVEKIRNR